MHKLKTLILNIYHHFMRDSLYRNSVFLIADTGIASGFGFIYWAAAAHLYSSERIGIAAALIAVSNIVLSLSLLGFDGALIHYLPKDNEHAHSTISLSLTLSILGSAITSVIYLLILSTVSPKLTFLSSSIAWILLFILFMVINTLNSLTNYIFIAFKSAHLVLSINAIYGISKVGLLFALAKWGLNGLISSYVLSVTLATVLSLLVLKQKFGYIFKPYFSKIQLNKMSKYMLGSYTSSIIGGAPLLLLPLLVIQKLGERQAAYYYITATISMLLNIIPSAVSQSLFVEGSWNKTTLKTLLLKSIKFMYVLTVPVIILLILAGKLILSVFGKEYSSAGYALLVLIALTGLPKVISYILSALIRISGRVLPLAIISLIGACTVLGLSYLLLGRYKLLGIGYATILGELIVVASYLVVIMYRKRRNMLFNK